MSDLLGVFFHILGNKEYSLIGKLGGYRDVGLPRFSGSGLGLRPLFIPVQFQDTIQGYYRAVLSVGLL